MEWIILPAIIFVIITVCTVTIIKNIIDTNSYIKNYFGKPPKDEDLNFDSIESLFLADIALQNHKHYIDDITWNDLEMDDVFARLNNTLSSVGEEYLYKTLRTPEFDENVLKKREKLITALENSPETLFKLQKHLYLSGKENYNGLSTLLLKKKYPSILNKYVINILAFLPIISLFFFPLNPGGAIVLSILCGCCNIIISVATTKRLDKNITPIKSFKNIIWLCKKVIQESSTIIPEFTNEVNKYYKTFKKIGKPFIITSKGNSDSDVIALYISMLFLSNLRIYNSATSYINKYHCQIEPIINLIGELDIAIAIMSYRKSVDFYCTPTFTDKFGIDCKEIYHPCLKKPVTNSADIIKNSIITGSNASGKSTFIKSIAINGILAQSIYTCLASEFALKSSLIITSMAVRDNLSQGDSYFIAEIKSLLRIIQTIDEVPCICFVDEILKGTNTIERIGASSAVLNYLNDKNCLCIVASHDIELTSILVGKYHNYNFCETITDNSIAFDYTIKEGPSTSRNAIKLLKYLDFDETIIADANNMVTYFTENQKWQ